MRIQRELVARSKNKRLRKKAPLVRPPLGIARTYARRLNELLAPLEEIVTKRVEAILPQLIEDAPLPRSDEGTRMDASAAQLIARTMSSLRVAYAERLSPEHLAQLALDFGAQTSVHNRKEINRQMRSVLGVDLPGSDPFLSSQLELFRSANVQLVTRMTEEQLARLERTLTAGARTGTRVETLREAIQADLGVSRSRATLIARDQVLKLNGELTQLRHREAGVEEYEWIASDDGAVRPQHKFLSDASKRGVTYKWSNPPVVDIESGRRAHPGEDYQCRCTANPVFRLPPVSR